VARAERVPPDRHAAQQEHVQRAVLRIVRDEPVVRMVVAEHVERALQDRHVAQQERVRELVIRVRQRPRVQHALPDRDVVFVAAPTSV
jgi:hypothetical protein